MKASFDLSGRVALITGAARGLGFEMARALGGAGALVYVNGSHRDRARLAAQRLQEEDIQALPMPFDVRDEAAGHAALEEVFATQGRLDILINNVGVRLREPMERIGSSEFREVLDANVIAAYSLSKQAAPLMAKGNYGRIINVSSIASERGNRGAVAYAVSKGALSSLTRVLAAEFGPYGITCNSIVPGTFLTETNLEVFKGEAMRDWFKSRTLLGRAGQPWEIGGAAVFLASPAAAYVTGIALPVDGGYLVA